MQFGIHQPENKSVVISWGFRGIYTCWESTSEAVSATHRSSSLAEFMYRALNPMLNWVICSLPVLLNSLRT